MTVLVDSSVWIDYFRTGRGDNRLDGLIDENIVAINDLILCELVPYLKLRNQSRIIELLNTIERTSLTIDWNQLIDWQYRCLKQGLNGIGIPDLIIAQNTIQHRCLLYSLDRHFEMIKDIVNIKLY
ncbi:twitching motility protein PilT [Desulfosarcina alkanivorans]|uniref:Twitching motility protein PilT n=1 Tax=Desulfosarcina alkanivorans TaxID=571177 RepID=A0A5K7YGV6_9BACT|nr:PIN domain-containing protein [Desulfosarcina alkanivorans]BBO67300.1 twitching motility protein PilT [Desulfosarcina alkanivorans]